MSAVPHTSSSLSPDNMNWLCTKIVVLFYLLYLFSLHLSALIGFRETMTMLLTDFSSLPVSTETSTHKGPFMMGLCPGLGLGARGGPGGGCGNASPGPQEDMVGQV